MIKDYGKLDIGPFWVKLRTRNGVWEFQPIYNHQPSSFASVEMNAEIRTSEPHWAPVPEDEVPKVLQVLKEKGRYP